MNRTGFRMTLLGVAAALAAPCALAQSEIVVYGLAMPFLDNAKTSGATSGAPAERPGMVPATAYPGANDAPRQRVTVGTSSLGFRGYETLGPELKLVWQLESGFQLDQNAGPGIGARDSKVGLSGPWGEVFLGQWDTPYKYISLPMNPLRAGYTFDRTAITGNPGFQVPNTTTQFTRIGAKPDASFDKRVGNSVQYWSPKLAGFTFRLGYSVDEGKGPVTAGGPIVSPTIAAASVQYDLGTLSVRYAYEEHHDYFGMSQIGGSAAGTAANSSSRDHGHKLLVLWLMGQTRITAMAEQLQYSNDDSNVGAVKRYKRNAFYGTIEQRFGNNAVWAAYGRAADGSCERVAGLACSARALGADYMNAGYIYRFSKRTEGYVAYYRLKNKESAAYSIGPVVGTSIAPGADVSGYGVGLWHVF